MDVSMSANVPDAGTVKQSKGNMQVIARCYKLLAKAKHADKRWRKRAKEGVEFYFDRQWSAADKVKLEGRDQPVITINRVKPTIRLIHGLVVSQPADILAKPVGKNDDEAADTATAALKYVNNVNDYKTLRERVYFDALTYGVGWAMAGLYVRDKDRRAEAVQYRRIDPREVRLDPNSQEPDISDARFVCWSRKVDVADAKDMYPKHAAAFDKLTALTDPNLGAEALETWDGVPDGSTPPVHLWETIREDFDNWDQSDKDSTEHDPKVVIHELWERYPTTAWLMEGADGVPEEMPDPSTPEGMALLWSRPDVVRYYEDTIFRVRYHVFCGPLLLVSEDSPYDHDRLPFVPCWGERDEHGDPVSAVETLKDPQREINHRRSKMIHELTRIEFEITQETLQLNGITLEEATERAAKGDAAWLVNQPGGIRYLQRGEASAQQFSLMQDSKAEIQATSGANDDLMGYDSSSRSGKAKEIAMTQGQTMLRPLESNLRLFDCILARMVLALIQQAHTEEWTVRVRDEVGRDRFITLNERVIDPETGMPKVLHTIEGMRFEIEIDQMPWSPTLRQRASEMINDMANNEQDPIIRNALRQAAILASDFPEKSKILDIFEGALQMVMPPPMDPGAMPPGMPPDPTMQPQAPVPPQVPGLLPEVM